MIEIKAGRIGFKNTLIEIDHLLLEAGSIHALIGSNGAGKSTFLNTLTGKTKALNGQFALSNKDLSTLRSKEFSRLVAFVESSFKGVEYLGLEEFILLGRSPYTDAFGRITKVDLTLANDAIALFGLEKHRFTDTMALSDGERQLASIAKAIAQDTPIILLDEPTAFLDYGNRKNLISELKKIALTKNKCILFSTHDIDLCIDEKIPVLIIDKESKQLVQPFKLMSKEEVLSIGFNMR